MQETENPSHRSTKLPSLLTAAMFIGLLTLGGAGLATRVNPGRPGIQGNIKPAAGLAKTASSWTDSRCENCHKWDALFSHPVDVTPTMPVPAHLPLENGRITCTTCHDSSDAADHSDARANHGDLLRPSIDPISFCQQCHNSADVSRVQQHGASLGQAHLFSPYLPSPASSASGLDDLSRTCVGCHDGAISTDVTLGQRFDPLGSVGTEHPVGVRYAPAMDRFGGPKGGMRLRSAESLDPRIHLFNGQIGCVSCHSPFSREESLMVMPNTRSRLCVSCHDE